MRRRAHPSLPILLVAAAIPLLAGSLVLEATLVRSAHTARAALPPALARADLDEVAATRVAATEATATVATHTEAAQALTAAGHFGDAARHVGFAARLEPGDATLEARADRAFDLALLARFRAAARIAAALSGAFLLVALVRRLRRRAAARRRAAWVEQVVGDVQVQREGRAAMAVDVFLRQRGPRARPPRPGPTLAVVLSDAASNTTIRLTPRRDVREDALRFRLSDATLSRVLARPGSWRVLVRLDDKPLAETRLEIASPVGRPAAPRLHPVG